MGVRGTGNAEKTDAGSRYIYQRHACSPKAGHRFALIPYS